MRPIRLGLTALLVVLVTLLAHPTGSWAAHPVGTLSDTQAKDVGNPKLKTVECLDCHVPHGAADTSLLKGRDHAEQACLGCHKEWNESRHAGGHPLDQVVTRRAAEALAKVGGALGPNNTVTCASCHTMHDDKAKPLDRCFACHEEQASVATTSDEKRGHRSPFCTDCHNKDSATLKASGSIPGDPTNCLRCHGPGSKNQPVDAEPGHLGHPLVDKAGGFDAPAETPLNGCPTCHGGHDIVKPDSTLCATCHKEQTEDHARGGHGRATCLDCHPIHESKALYAATKDGQTLNPVQRRCLACHAKDAEGDANTPRVDSYQHPVPMFGPDGQRWQALGGLPLFDPNGVKVGPTENGDLTCASCHLSHGPDRDKPGDALRRPGWDQMCPACHGDDALLYYRWFHFRERLEGVADPPARKDTP